MLEVKLGEVKDTSNLVTQSPARVTGDRVCTGPIQSEGGGRGKIKNLSEQLVEVRKLVEQNAIQTLEPLLPLLLTLKGKPYTLEDHFPFAPLFRTRMAKSLTVKSGRQTSKTTSLASNGVVVASAIPFFSTLYVTPLFEQARRISTNYVRPFIEGSPVKSLWAGTSTENSVLQKSFKNESKLFFSFALLDADRVRGISADRLVIDECQDMDPDHIPIIREVMSHSEWDITWHTGTPKTDDNALEKLWLDSSQAEWFIPCRACKHWNIPGKEYDLLKIIGPLHDRISEEEPATICAKCRRSIQPRSGRWVHRYPDKRWSQAGYHIPQVIMPIHYAKRKKWAELLGKQRGAGNTTTAQFYNEVLGESYDQSTKLVNLTDLLNAAVLPWHNTPEDYVPALKYAGDYSRRCLAVDWGGGGEKETSFTTLAVLGWNNGQIDVIWGRRLLTPHDHLGEAKYCLQVYNAFRCHFLTHDYTGAGALRETFIHHAGIPLDSLIPVSLVRTAHKDIMNFHSATRQHPRDFHQLDKARSLQLTCNSIKLKIVKFFKDDYRDKDDPGLLRDFLALMENKVPMAHTGDMYTIVRNPMFKDDFAQAVNIGCCALWHSTQAWPNLASVAHLQLNESQLSAAAPPRDLTWEAELRQ